MPLKKKRSNFFPLDSNIDGYFVDSEGREHKVENMIQVVGATDGSQSYPAISGGKLEDFDYTQISSVDDLTEQQGNRGHGVLYDEDGRAYAKKGDLVFRDTKYEASFQTIVNKVKSILQTPDNDVLMIDSSLEEILRRKQGVSLDDLIAQAERNDSPFGLGNIVQATRNENYNDISTNIFTLPLTAENTVWVLAHATVQGEGAIQLRDVSSNTILSTSYARAANGTDSVPVYLSFVGNLPGDGGVGTDAECCQNASKAIYNSFYKRFFIPQESENPGAIHELALEVIKEDDDDEGNPIITPYTHASLNVLVMDNTTPGKVYTGLDTINQAISTDVSFETPLDSEDYSISIQTENAISYWYSNKSTGGFTINFEREYFGKVFWTVIGDLVDA